VGAEGIEAYYETELEGVPGRIITAKDRLGDRYAGFHTKSIMTPRTLA
jgi:cell division protein FtsI/penicillin-binding protein 2